MSFVAAAPVTAAPASTTSLGAAASAASSSPTTSPAASRKRPHAPGVSPLLPHAGLSTHAEPPEPASSTGAHGHKPPHSAL
eukprot:902382-Prymnesium_polylepis.1